MRKQYGNPDLHAFLSRSQKILELKKNSTIFHIKKMHFFKHVKIFSQLSTQRTFK